MCLRIGTSWRSNTGAMLNTYLTHVSMKSRTISYPGRDNVKMEQMPSILCEYLTTAPFDSSSFTPQEPSSSPPQAHSPKN